MLDNLIVNIRSFMPTSKKNVTEEKFSHDYNVDESTIAFIARNATNVHAQQSVETGNQHNVLNVVRSYFNQLYGKQPASDADSIMLPRVYNYQAVDCDPIDLKAKEKFVDDIDNVIDKFARVISVNETNSPRRSEFFYVPFLFFHFALVDFFFILCN